VFDRDSGEAEEAMSENSGATQRKQGQRRPRHVPQRTCVACREKEAKRAFVRIVRTPEKLVEIDQTGKKNGRGAYLCTRRSCWDKAVTGNVLDRALNVTLDQVTRDTLHRYADHHFRDE
jgi:uncharacterized protein